MQRKVRISTRSSKLAIAQAKMAAAALQQIDPDLEYQICCTETTGDKMLDLNLATVGGKGLFLKEIEQSLLSNESDIAVHSMKDVPVSLPEGLIIPAMLQRGDPRDALISLNGYTIDSLPYGAIIGTCATRRTNILNNIRPDLNIVPVRGNIESRINKLKAGQYDAIVLAVCGIQRAHLTDVPHVIIPTDIMVPAIGQGVIGLECRADDEYILNLLKQVNHHTTFLHTSIEREFMRGMDADCTTPIGGYVDEYMGKMRLRTYYKSSNKANITTFIGTADELVPHAILYYNS